MSKKEILFGVFVAIFLALALSPFASSSPDGLEKVADDKGFLEKGEVEPIIPSPIPDYTWPGIGNERLATSAAGVFGTLFVFGFTCIIAGLVKR